ncbi:MAG: hypothetical protein CVU60_08035 [Deltaproteobacteria bacterium HGW-Deltaproteobacteria-18]|nr:MAG: hypothetical protein CVU60_08035 [Deltaproteobacteria bacterium HGW-Deltaproteobacteria-18]
MYTDMSSFVVRGISCRLSAALLLLLCALIFCRGLAFAKASDDISPSQVLVLYNADWRARHPLIPSAQDSLAVAEHYARMHTDPVTGERPYLLGLTGARSSKSLLAGDHLQERSHDNSCGVVYQPRDSKRPVPACEMRDSRMVEVALPRSKVPWDLGTLRLEIESDDSSSRTRLVLVENGLSLYPDKVRVRHGEDWQIRALGGLILPGSFTARARCGNVQGDVHEWSAEYKDIRQASWSSTGLDGIRDDQNYLDFVEAPIKAFLEDPSNARPDGTLLKDHVLYIVVCHGLPRTVSAPYGIATGVGLQLRDYGSEIDFCQRLQLMYYDFKSLHLSEVQPMRFAPVSSSKPNAFANILLRTRMSMPLEGVDANPFVHPAAYRKGGNKAGLGSPRFTSALRALRPDRHLFFAMRIDGQTPLEAMELVDRGVYASRYAGPELGVLPDIPLRKAPERVGEIGDRTPAKPFWDLGYRHLFQHPKGRVRLDLFRLAPDCGFFNSGPVFLPGGIAAFVQSNQGWNVKNSRFHEFLRQGVTVTAGAARVDPRKTPHIHSHSFWDEAVFYPALREGRPVGEILLGNQVHMGWITSFVGDPLYRLPLVPQKPGGLNGLTWEKNVRVAPVRDAERGRGYLVMADLGSSAHEPRLAQMRLGRIAAEGDGAKHVFERFASRPCIFVPKREVRKRDPWRLELMDPFGNTATLAGTLE